MKRSVLVAAMSLSACSFAITEGPPANYAAKRQFDCSTRRVPPMLDALAAAAASANAVVASSGNDSSYHGANKNTAMLVSSIAAGTFVASAIFGFVTVNQCRDAMWSSRYGEDSGRR